MWVDEHLTIRAATVGDAEAMIDLHHAAVHRSAVRFYAVHVLDGWSPMPDDVRYERRRNAVGGGELLLVAEWTRKVVAFGSIVPDNAELRALYVHPDFQGRSIGRRLLSALEGLAISRGLDRLGLVASLNAEAFYSRSGYEVMERGIHRLSSGHEMACVHMRKAFAHERPSDA